MPLTDEVHIKASAAEDHVVTAAAVEIHIVPISAVHHVVSIATCHRMCSRARQESHGGWGSRAVQGGERTEKALVVAVPTEDGIGAVVAVSTCQERGEWCMGGCGGGEGRRDPLWHAAHR
tara:strand:- start:1034 stop:1393 length:360 start_codon:yes stop_codon:yes gene_type:complete